jgi:hypothetical protein
VRAFFEGWKTLATPLSEMVLGLGVVSVFSACAGGGDLPAFEVRDSAGVEIVESFRPLLEGEEEWRVGPEPLLRMGVVEGDPAYQFDGVAGMVRLAGGTVAVADFGYQNVRFFDRDGGIVRTFGGPGEGPREFQSLVSLGLGTGGRIWAYDFLLRRITWLDRRGEMTDLTRLPPEPAMLQPLGALPDKTFLLKQLWAATQVAEATETGLRRDPVAFVRFDPEEARFDTLGLFPGRELFLTDEDGRGVMSTPPYPKNSMGAVWRERVVVGSNDRFELVVLTSSGEVERIFRLPDLDLTLGPGEREEYVEDRVELVAENLRPGVRHGLEAMPFPDTRPAFGALLPDDQGNLWVADWVLTPKTPEHLKVFDSSGRWLCVVDVPERFSPFQIGGDWILGAEWDDLDVEYVVLYPLLKEPANG